MFDSIKFEKKSKVPFAKKMLWLCACKISINSNKFTPFNSEKVTYVYSASNKYTKLYLFIKLKKRYPDMLIFNSNKLEIFKKIESILIDITISNIINNLVSEIEYGLLPWKHI